MGVIRDSIVIYESFVDAIREMPKESCKRFSIAFYDFWLNGIEPQLPALELCLFNALKKGVEKAKNRYEASVKNGAKGGNPNFKKGQGNPYYSKKDNLTLTTDNLNVNNFDDDINNNNILINKTIMRACEEIYNFQISQAKLDAVINVFTQICGDELEILLKENPSTLALLTQVIVENGLDAEIITPEIVRAIIGKAELIFEADNPRGYCYKILENEIKINKRV